MAYALKYRFRFESANGATYSVNIWMDGYSGDVIDRPLGKAPVLTKSQNGCIRSTTLDLVLECHVDGEYSEFYNAAPGTYRVDLFRGNTQIWQGTIVSELYSAPEIAPPYDVKVSANDGIALSKEFIYQPQGAITPRALIKYLLQDVPVNGRDFYVVSSIGADNLTPANFWNTALINLDYKTGETKYDVLTYFLDTIHATITLHNGKWLIARETDVTMSGGSIPCLLASINSSSVSSSSITGAVQSAGQMGVATLWPIGHMSTNISPAKRRVTVEAPYHVASGAPSVAANGWSIYDDSHARFSGMSYVFTYATLDDNYGEVYAQIPIRSFTKDLRLSIKVATYLAYVYVNKSDLKIYVAFTPTGGSTKHYNGIAWSSSSEVFQNPDLPKPVGTVETPQDFSFDISPAAEFADGVLDITFVGRRVELYDAVLETIIGAGFKDTIAINNGARGDGDTVEIAGARVADGDVVSSAFLQGVFLKSDTAPAENFVDNNFTSGLSFMSLTALGYALSVALPRLDLSGTFNFPAGLDTVPLVITYGGVNYWVETYDFNMLEDELRLTARSLPSATLSVESETIIELQDEDARGGSSSGGGGGGGGGGGSYTLPVASASTLGGIKVGSGLSIDSSTGVLSATGGGGGGGGIGSVGLSMPTPFSVANSPLTADGTINVTLKSTYTIPTTQDWNGVRGSAHSHGNLELLEDITSQDVGNWDDAASKAHTHSNKSVLDGITASKVSQWDSATGDDTIAVSIEGTNAAPTVKVALGSGSNDSELLPIASSSKSGLVSTGDQTFAGNKTFTRIYLGNSAQYGMYIEWDDTNHMFKIVGDVYATGDVAAGG